MAWNLPDQNSVTASPRPLRVAYLVDVKNLAHELLDKIFAESYSRWGGRRTLIVPATKSGIDEGYEKWLWYNDPDVIYSYVKLSDEAIRLIHEKFCPAHLQIHHTHGDPQSNHLFYKPSLSIDGLGCLSILPSLKARKGLFRNYDNIKIIDVDWSVKNPRFFEDNFGLISNYSSNVSLAENFPEFFTPLTLITSEALNGPCRVRSKVREFITDEKQFLDKIATRGETILSLANLSDCLAQHLNFNYDEQSQTFNLVIGDTPTDRLIFWNFYQHYSNVWPDEILTMCVSPSILDNQDYLDSIRKIIETRFWRTSYGNQKTIILRSNSVAKDELESIAKKLKNKTHIYFKSEVITNLSEIVPVFKDKDRIYYASNPEIDNHSIRRIDHFSDQDVRVPLSQPYHISDQNVPPALRNGYWGIDAAIERVHDYCPYDNVRHVWLFPRRLRIDQFITRLDENHPRECFQRNLRANRSGLLSIFVNHLSHQPIIRMPDDSEAIAYGLINDRHNFDTTEGTQQSLSKKYRYTRISDKGKYLRGVVQMLGSLHEAIDFFLHSFWMKVFNDLGASPSHEREILINTIVKKQLKTLPETDEDKKRIAEFCLREADKIAREKRYVSWSDLDKNWDALFENWMKKNQQHADKKDQIKESDKKSLEWSTQLLCQSQILFQGQEWTCRKCQHKNWVSIDNLKSVMTCEVCGNNEPAPISKDWKFRANDFVMQALRYHGIWPVIWCLKLLIEKKHNMSSFYYSSSLSLFDTDESYAKNIPDAEIDLIAVIDDEVFLCEIKSSNIKDKDIQKFIKIANRIRPDVALLAIMEEKNNKTHQELMKKVDGKLDAGIKLEVMYLQKNHMEDWPGLPTGKSKRVRVF